MKLHRKVTLNVEEVKKLLTKFVEKKTNSKVLDAEESNGVFSFSLEDKEFAEADSE